MKLNVRHSIAAMATLAVLFAPLPAHAKSQPAPPPLSVSWTDKAHLPTPLPEPPYSQIAPSGWSGRWSSTITQPSLPRQLRLDELSSLSFPVAISGGGSVQNAVPNIFVSTLSGGAKAARPFGPGLLRKAAENLNQPSKMQTLRGAAGKRLLVGCAVATVDLQTRNWLY